MGCGGPAVFQTRGTGVDWIRRELVDAKSNGQE